METTTLKRFYSIIIVAFFILNSSIFPISQTATASEYPGWGNWVIDDNTTVTGETIVVHGDVIVKNGSSLTLDHCTLKIESIVPGNNGIEVEAGGELYVYNTTITAYQSYQYYKFEVQGKLKIEGGDIGNIGRFGIHLSNTTDAIIKNSNIHNVYAIEVYYYSYACGIVLSDSNGTIIGNNIYECERGIRGEGKSNIRIKNNDISNNQRFGVILRDECRVNITDNIITNNGGGAIGEMGYERGGISIAGNCIVHISNNIIDSNKGAGIICWEDCLVNVSNNIVSNNEQDGFYLQDNACINIVNNTILSNGKDSERSGIHGSDSTTLKILGNIISNGWVGIFTKRNSKASILGNTIDSNIGSGVVCDELSIVEISDNIINSNPGNGIQCQLSSKVLITKNIIANNAGRGIQSQPSLDMELTVADNYIYNNGECGICITSSSSCIIQNNTLISNLCGIVLGSLSKPKIYNCTITNSEEYDISVNTGSHPTLINTQFDFDKLFFNDTESIISIGHWVDVNARNKNNVPVQNARVAVMNNNGTEVFNGTSDYDGHFLAPVVEYDLDYTFTKKEWTPHTVHASKLGESASEKITVDRNRIVNFTLDISDKLARGNLITQMVEGHEVTVEYSGNGTVTIEPAAKPAKIPNATKDIGIFVNINAVGDVEDLYITIRYSDNELGKVNEANLRMYCYFNPGDFNPGDFNPGDFELLNPGDFTGGWVKIKNSGVDTYGNVVWAKVSHLTIFAPMAEETAKPVSSGNIWYLYGGAGVTSLAVLWLVFFITFRKRTFHKSKTGKQK